MKNMRKTDKYRLRENRSSHSFEKYVPFIKVHEFSNKARAHRMRGRIIDRIYHLMSDLEFSFFIFIQQFDNVIDIKEQIPLLPLLSTVMIAKDLGIPHPPISKCDNQIMTSDFLVTYNDEGRIKECVYCLKYSTDLNNKRTMDKLEIERVFWQQQCVEWNLITENSFDLRYYKNLMCIYSSSFWLDNPVNLSFFIENEEKVNRILTECQNKSLNIAINILCNDYRLNRKMLYGCLKYMILIGRIFVNTSSSIELFESTYEVE